MSIGEAVVITWPDSPHKDLVATVIGATFDGGLLTVQFQDGEERTVFDFELAPLFPDTKGAKP